MSPAVAAAGARMRCVGTDQQRYGHPHSRAGGRFVLSDLAVAVPTLAWGTRSYLAYRVARWFAGAQFCRGSKSCLRSGGLPAGAQFRHDLACSGISIEVANPFSWLCLPPVCSLYLLWRDFSRGNAGRGSADRNSTAAMERSVGDGRHRFGGGRIFLHLFDDHASGLGISVVLEFRLDESRDGIGIMTVYW